jgi:predicted alpha/beta hydrolase family esterase
MTKTLIVPGLDGSPAPHWQDWWARTDADAMMVDLPAPYRPVVEIWEATLAMAILKHPHSILVGHSLGSILIARMLSRWPDLKVRGAVLVAPADPSRSERIRRFDGIPATPFDIPSIVVASRNDPWMSFEQAADLADQWGSTVVDMGLAGHINVAAGFGPWPGGKLIRDSLIQQTSRMSPIRRLIDSATGRLRDRSAV